MRNEFRQALAAAADQADPRDRITTIKRAVATEVRAADPAVKIRTTEYFNHSLAPDMVLSWPQERDERLLFLRAQASPEWLLEDVELKTARGSVLFTLEDFNEAGPVVAEEAQQTRLDTEASRAEAWITDPSGIAAISSVRLEHPVLGLLGQALVRGGKGLGDSRHVGALTTSTMAGFDGAAGVDAEPTRRAVDAIQEHLSEVQSGRLTRVLRAVWEGNGGSASDFPSASDVGRLTDDDLAYLLSVVTESPEEFWRRVGRAVTTEQIGRLRISDPSASLQALVRANLDRLQAKAVRLLDRQFQLGEPETVPRWIVDRGCLTLRGLNWAAYLAGKKIEELPTAEEVRPPDLPQLKQRAQATHAAITRVQFTRGDRVVTYESPEGTDVLEDVELAKLVEDIDGVNVEAATAAMPGGGDVEVGFRQRSATGHTSAVFPIGVLLRSAIPLVHDLTDDELGTFGDLLPAPVDEGLFADPRD